ncbi:MAG: O-antigen ligase family protein [Nitrospira sp.]
MILAVSCFLSVTAKAVQVYAPVALAFCTGISTLAIHFMFFEVNDNAMAEALYFLGWLELLVIVQALSLRPGFLHRFAIVALAIGLATVPYVNLTGGAGAIVRASAVGTALANGNALGMWFGFCTVYSIFWGFQSQNIALRITSWAIAVGCFYMVAITVSRGPVLAIALACIVGFRSMLKHSFVPLLVLVLMISLLYLSGVFDQELESYTSRGVEESGRGKLFPRALERILNSPWIGVGLDDIKVPYGGRRVMNPHNGLLHIWLGAGIVPAMCFLGYLWRVAIGTRHLMRMVPVDEAMLIPPLVVFGLVEFMVLDYTFMSPWTVVAFGLAAGAGQAYARRAPPPLQ